MEGQEKEIAPEGLQGDKSEKRFKGTVRPLLISDVEKIRPIMETWIRDSETGEVFQDEIDEISDFLKNSLEDNSDRHYLVAEDTTCSVVGVMGYKKPFGPISEFIRTKNPREIVNAFVDPQQKGIGVGRAMISEIERIAINDGITEIILDSGPRYAETGWGFYDKMSYLRVGELKNRYGEGRDAPVWRKELNLK